MANTETFDSVLKRWKLDDYAAKFEEEGWDDVEGWNDLVADNETLEDLISKKGHRAKFIRMFKKEFATKKGKDVERKDDSKDDHKDAPEEQKVQKVQVEKTPMGTPYINPKTNKVEKGFYVVPSTVACSDPQSVDYRNFQKKRIIASGKAHKIILVVGETGSGKSTVLNSMVNYLYGVEYQDKFRYNLIIGKAKKSSSMSQTDYVTSYELADEGLVTDYSLTVVDTPGFGDTRGVDHDMKIMKDIKHWFEKKLETLDAVCFVIKSSETRLTHTQLYVFQSILNLFGNDVSNNIFALITFCDASDPPALQALKDAKIPITNHFRLNNSVFFKDPINKGEAQVQMFDKFYWDMGIASFKLFFGELYKTSAVSLTLTRKVLDARQVISEKISDLNMKLDIALSQVDELEKQKRWVRKHADDLNANKEEPYYEEVAEFTKAYGGNSWVTTCTVCANMTCHSTCGVENKVHCCMMTDNKCDKCGCPDTYHENRDFAWVKTMKRVKKTNWNDTPDMKKRYDAAATKKSRAQHILDNCDQELKDTETFVTQCILAVKDSINELSRIALNKNVLSTKDYVEKIIDVEKKQKKKGYQRRVESLEKLGKESQRIEEIQNGKFNFKQAVGWQEEKEDPQSNGSIIYNVKKMLGWRN